MRKKRLSINLVEANAYINELRLDRHSNNEILKRCKTYFWQLPAHTSTVRRFIRSILEKEAIKKANNEKN